MNIYKIIEPGLPATGAVLLCDDGVDIFELRVQQTYDRTYIKHHLAKGVIHCKSIDEKCIQKEFFKKSKQYEHISHHSDELYKVNLEMGVYHPRIYRPIIWQDNFSAHIQENTTVFSTEKLNYIPHDLKVQVQGVQQLCTLIKKLDVIFDVVYPNQKNFNCFGHEMRNLLILTCTEVEAQLKGVLLANDYKEKKRYDMSDYGNLNVILKLNQYSVTLPFFPEVQPIFPFKDWDGANPTKELFWYKNYNHVKHDREENFHFATLESVINAICALAVLFYAQYGRDIQNWNELIGTYFYLNETPVWKFDEHYLPPFDRNKWNAKKVKVT